MTKTTFFGIVFAFVLGGCGSEVQRQVEGDPSPSIASEGCLKFKSSQICCIGGSVPADFCGGVEYVNEEHMGCEVPDAETPGVAYSCSAAPIQDPDGVEPPLPEEEPGLIDPPVPVDPPGPAPVDSPAPAPLESPAPVPAESPVPAPQESPVPPAVNPPATGSQPSSSLNNLEKALIRANAVSSFSGNTACVYNARDTLLRSVRNGSNLSFTSVEDIVAILMPRGATAKIIGQNLKANWRDFSRRQQRWGVSGWHPVNIERYKRDHAGKMWPNGIVFSGGTQMGHVSLHVSAIRPANFQLDQYSTRALKSSSELLRRTLENRVRQSEDPTTHPGLVARVQRYAIFQWCHDAWGCPSDAYLLD